MRSGPEGGKIVFLGSGPFAVPILEALAASPYRPVLVVTRPDRPAGRGRRLLPTPVKLCAEDLSLPVKAPASANDPQFLERLSALSPDLLIVADYGEILRQPIRDAARIGAFNLHASLLPRHRGAAPVAAALLAGDDETGVTLFRIVKGLDQGPIIDRVSTPILPLENAGDLEARLADMAAEMLLRDLPTLASKRFSEEAQDEKLATLAPKLAKGSGKIDWSQPPASVVRIVRALSPRPGAYGLLSRPASAPEEEPERVRILRAGATSGRAPPGTLPGTITWVEKHRFRVAAGGGEVEVLDLQPEARSPMSAAEFLRGYPLLAGDLFLPADRPPAPPGSSTSP